SAQGCSEPPFSFSETPPRGAQARRRGPGRPGPLPWCSCLVRSGLGAAVPVLDRVAQVEAGTAVARVRALAALEHVGAVQTDHQVVAAAALEGVVRGGPGEHVVALATGEQEVEAAPGPGLPALDGVVELGA